MKNSQKGSAIIFFVVFLALLIIASGTYFIVHKQQSSQNVSENSQVPQNNLSNDTLKAPPVKQEPPKSQGTSDETASWKIYSDTSFGYTLKYPPEYTLWKYDPPCGSSLNNTSGQNIRIWISDFINHNDVAYSNDIRQGKIIDFDVNINDPDDQCVSSHYSLHVESGTKGYKLVGSENVVVNGYNALKRNYIDTDVPGSSLPFKFSTWRFQKGTTYYTLLYNNGVTVDPQLQKDLFAEFLSTFKFTSAQTVSTEPSITVLSPNGGETWNRNANQTIRWSYDGLNSNDEIIVGFRTSDPSVCWYKGTSPITVGQGSLTLIPSQVQCDGRSPSVQAGGQFKIQIGVVKYDTGKGVADYSDDYFTISK